MFRGTQRNPALVAVTLSGGVFAFSTFMGLVSALLVDLSKELGTTVAVTGQLATITAVSWGIMAPLAGPWSDRIGHKRMLTIGLAIFAISVIGYTVSKTYWALVVSSTLAGMGGGLVGPSGLACVADYYSARSYGRAMAANNAASPLAYLLGVPGTVLIAGSLGWRYSFLSLAVIFVLCLLAVICILPPSQHHQSGRSATYISRFSEALRDKSFLPILIANTISQGAYWLVVTYLAAFLILNYAISTSQLAPLLSIMAVGQLVGMLAGGPLADRFNKLKICMFTAILVGVTGVILILYARNIYVSVFCGGLLMGFWGVGRPAYFSLMALVSSTVRGTVMGIQAVSNQLGRAAGAAAGGLALAFTGFHFLGILCLVLGLAASAMYLFLVFFMHRTSNDAASKS